MTRKRGFTLIEVLTALAIVAVLVAIAVPMWRTHTMRVRRADASAALIAVQRAQDTFFAQAARYAATAELTTPPPAGLGLGERSPQGYYRITLSATGDSLGYVATATSENLEGREPDTRCAQLSLDHNGQRRAQDDHGEDRSADCWR